MRVGFNAWHYIPGTLGGGEVYILNLLRGLKELESDVDLIVFTTPLNHTELVKLGVKCHRYPIPANNRSIRACCEQIALPSLCRKHSIDVLHTSANVGLLFPSSPVVLTMHDMYYLQYPRKLRSWYYRLLLPTTARRSAHVITISKKSAAQIASNLRLAEDKISVIYPAADEAYFARSEHPRISDQLGGLGLGEKFLLYVGSGSPHKNIGSLLEAFCLIHRQFPDYQLAIVGDMGDWGSRLLKQANFLGISDRVAFTGRVPKADLVEIYRAAAAFVFPSLYEGFGIPLIEAMASGVPIVSSHRSCLPEICGDAAILVDPLNVPAIANSIIRILTDDSLRATLIRKGVRRARDFSWKVATAETLAVYRRVAGYSES